MVFFVVVFLWSCADYLQQVIQVMLAKNYKLIISTTAASLMLGLLLAFVYMASNGQEDAYLLVLLQFALVAILIGWLIGLLLLAFKTTLRFFKEAFSGFEFRGNYLADEGPAWELIRIRREMIALRLGVDDPCNCSKRRITCDYWSLCDGSPYSRIDHSALAPGYLVSLMKKSDAESSSLIHIKNRKKSS